MSDNQRLNHTPENVLDSNGTGKRLIHKLHYTRRGLKLAVFFISFRVHCSLGHSCSLSQTTHSLHIDDSIFICKL